jgi:hypothetical protein
MAEPDPPVRAQYFARHFRAAMSVEDRRADAQRHLDSRTDRISAYITSLEAALLLSPNGERGALLERRLEQARQDLGKASRFQLGAAASPPAAKVRVGRARTGTEG